MYYTKINSEQIIDLNVNPTTINLLKGNTGENLWDLELGEVFLDMIQKHNSCKKKKNQEIVLHQNWKHLFHERPVKRMKRQATYWEELLANHITDRALITEICKEFLKPNCSKAIQLENGQKDVKKHFTEEDL